MRRFTVLIAVAALLGVAPAASFGSIEPVGPPMQGNSWYQGFMASSDVGFNGVLINMTVGTLENSAAPWAFRSFSNPSVAPLSQSGIVNVPSSPASDTLALAQGPDDVFALSWSFAFVGSSDNHVAFDVALFNVADDLILSGHFDWNSPDWTPTEVSAEGIADLRVAYNRLRPPPQSAVPEPATLVIWSVLGAGAAGLGSLRRRRPRWSEESRAAIRQIIARGRTQR